MFIRLDFGRNINGNFAKRKLCHHNNDYVCFTLTVVTKIVRKLIEDLSPLLCCSSLTEFLCVSCIFTKIENTANFWMPSYLPLVLLLLLTYEITIFCGLKIIFDFSQLMQWNYPLVLVSVRTRTCILVLLPSKSSNIEPR